MLQDSRLTASNSATMRGALIEATLPVVMRSTCVFPGVRSSSATNLRGIFCLNLMAVTSELFAALDWYGCVQRMMTSVSIVQVKGIGLGFTTKVLCGCAATSHVIADLIGCAGIIDASKSSAQLFPQPPPSPFTHTVHIPCLPSSLCSARVSSLILAPTSRPTSPASTRQ